MHNRSATVPLNDLGRTESALKAQIGAAIQRVVDSGWYVLGPENDSLESELAAYLGTGHSVTVANGTDALQLALMACGVEPGDRVMTAANAGGYTSTAARAIGAVPAYADVEPDSLLLTASTLGSAVDRLGTVPAAVVVTHLYGRSADMVPVMEWADRVGTRVIEDCAQSLGAVLDGRRSGSFGHAATTSFYPTKNLGALGDGGAVLTSDPDVAGRVRRLRQYGWDSKYHATVPGGRNSRMDELQAAVVRVKLPHLDRWNDRRREIHRRYEDAVPAGVRMVNTSGPGFVGHLAVLETADRPAAVAHFDGAGVRTDVHYPVPDHRQPIACETPQPHLEVTEAAVERVLSLPLFAELTDPEVERVVAALAELPT